MTETICSRDNKPKGTFRCYTEFSIEMREKKHESKSNSMEEKEQHLSN